MVATERDGNISYRIQALDMAGNPIGTERTTSVGTYIDTGVQADPANFPGENVHASIYPLTAFVPSGDDIYGFRIRYRNSSSGDGGDGKTGTESGRLPGNGGNGGNGHDGKNGNNATEENYVGILYYGYIIERGEDGTRGGDGGAGDQPLRGFRVPLCRQVRRSGH